jgi:hypothetical protein
LAFFGKALHKASPLTMSALPPLSVKAGTGGESCNGSGDFFSPGPECL